MTWTKLSDDFTDDCWTLSDKAFRLHVEGLVWSNRKLLDLTIPKVDVRRFAKSPDALADLLAAGWWTDNGDHYTIRHHAGYQRNREDVVKQQEANRANGAKGGRPRIAKPSREQWQETQSVNDSQSQSKAERDRTGQASKNGTTDDTSRPDVGFTSTLPKCQHGMVNGDVADPFVGGRLGCPECASRVIA